MNEKTKKVIYFIIGILFFPIVWLLSRLSHNRKPDDRIKPDFQSARESVKESKDRIEQCIRTNNDTRESIEQCITATEELEHTTGRAAAILNEIKKQTV